MGLYSRSDQAEIDFFHHITPPPMADRSENSDGRNRVRSRYSPKSGPTLPVGTCMGSSRSVDLVRCFYVQSLLALPYHTSSVSLQMLV